MDAQFEREIIQKTGYYKLAEDKENFNYDEWEVISGSDLLQKAIDRIDEMVEIVEHDIKKAIGSSYFAKDYVKFDYDKYRDDCLIDGPAYYLGLREYEDVEIDKDDYVDTYYVILKDEVSW